MRISMQPCRMKIMIDQKHLQNVEYLKYLSSMITNDARCTRGIKSRIPLQGQCSVRSMIFSPGNWT